MDSTSTLVSRPPPPPVAPKKTFRRYLFVVLFALAGAGLGYFGARYALAWLAPVTGPRWIKLLLVLGLPFIWLAVAGIHELGHVIGGWLGGGRFLLWMVGPFMLRRTPVGIRPAWNRSVNLAGGMAVCVPLEPAKVTPRRMALMIAAGPVASLALALAALALAHWVGSAELTNRRALGQNLLGFTGVMSFLIFLVTVAPSAVGGFKSDGKRFFELRRGDHRSEQEAALLVLTSTSLTGVRPADYDPALVRRVLSLGDGSLFDLYGHLSVYYYAADRGDWAAAQGHLDYVIASFGQIVPYARDIVRCEYAWLLATCANDPATARAWLDSAGRLDFDPATRLRAEAAVLWAEGKSGEAAAKAREGLHALAHRSLSPVQSPFAAEALENLLARAKAGERPFNFL